MGISDFQINSSLRMVLVRHMVDLSRVEFSSCRGTVRVRGHFVRLGLDSGGFTPTQVESIENEMNGISGVKRVYFELENWLRTSSGEWKAMDRCQEGLGHKLVFEAKAAENSPQESKG
ncbi:MAG: hypothetical protein HY721_01180 [Planctomycetes bacterium]|nr:hypothetical protein [Planctomycetota bacterium]